VLALAVLLRRNGHRPIIGVYTKNYIAPFESLGIDVLPLAKFRPRLLGLNRSREIGFEPDAMDLMPVAISNAEFDGNEGIEGWEMRAAISHLVAARRALFQSGADALVVWNGVTGHFANAFRCLKRELNLPGGFLERGLLSDGIYFDPN
jgi:hypothetical protein